jgi:hypothetical protein
VVEEIIREQEGQQEALMEGLEHSAEGEEEEDKPL